MPVGFLSANFIGSHHAVKRRLLPLHALRAFEAAARHAHLGTAGEELGVTYSAISHQIRSLEALLGTALFDRRHRPLKLTPDGEQLLATVVDAFDQLATAADGIQGGGYRGEITISCIPGLAANWLAPILGDFLAIHPRIKIHMLTDYWRRPSTFEEADIAIHYGSAEQPNRRVVRLGHSEFFPVCSPRLLGGIDPIRRPEDLRRYTLLHEYNDESWSRWFAAAGVKSAPDARGVYFDSAHLALQAARAGYGIAMGDTPTVAADLREGRLMQPFLQAVPAVHPYYLITAPLDRIKPIAGALESWLIERFASLRSAG
jgi:DNA-binding transcriptional LysR family regulator